MAGRDAIISTNHQSHVSRHQYDALWESHKAFHEVAIKVTDILLDPSRSAQYQSLPSRSGDNTDVNYIDNGPSISEGDNSTLRQQSHGVRNYSSQHALHRPEPKPASDQKSTLPTFQMENMRARKTYRKKQQRSIKMYARASGSYVDAEYDFQCMPVL